MANQQGSGFGDFCSLPDDPEVTEGTGRSIPNPEGSGFGVFCSLPDRKGEITLSLYVFLHTSKVHIQIVEVLQQSAKRGALRHLRESVHIFREAFTAITILAIRARNVGVGVVDVS